VDGERYGDRAAGPLAGVRVLDMTHHLAGALATLMLADLGAGVVKVEPPGGEPLRALDVDGLEPFRVLNRDKRSIVVDLRHPDGPALLRSLLGEVDVFAENFRPGVLDRFGLGYEQVAGAHPELVYCSISGFADEPGYERHPGFDLAAQALGGLLAVAGDDDGPAKRGGAPFTSVGAGMLAVGAILAAYVRRLRTGRGGHVTASLLGAAHGFAILEAARPRGRRIPLVFPEGVYQAADGWLIMSAGDQGPWERLCALIGRDDLVGAARYATPALRREHHRELGAELTSAFAGRATAEWLAELHAAGIGCAPVRDVARAAAGGDVPAPGQDTRRALADLGVPDGRVDALLASGAVRQAGDETKQRPHEKERAHDPA
jgi:crotonobetainyl-CoA:carnitine CoA-transferase CaiB-like acyl-CoA transferase